MHWSPTSSSSPTSRIETTIFGHVHMARSPLSFGPCKIARTNSCVPFSFLQKWSRFGMSWEPPTKNRTNRSHARTLSTVPCSSSLRSRIEKANWRTLGSRCDLSFYFSIQLAHSFGQKERRKFPSGCRLQTIKQGRQDDEFSVAPDFWYNRPTREQQIFLNPWSQFGILSVETWRKGRRTNSIFHKRFSLPIQKNANGHFAGPSHVPKSNERSSGRPATCNLSYIPWWRNRIRGNVRWTHPKIARRIHPTSLA